MAHGVVLQAVQASFTKMAIQTEHLGIQRTAVNLYWTTQHCIPEDVTSIVTTVTTSNTYN
jgi:hypothetical protein